MRVGDYVKIVQKDLYPVNKSKKNKTNPCLQHDERILMRPHYGKIIGMIGGEYHVRWERSDYEMVYEEKELVLVSRRAEGQGVAPTI